MKTSTIAPILSVWRWWEPTFVPLLICLTIVCWLGFPLAYLGVQSGSPQLPTRLTVTNLTNGDRLPKMTTAAQMVAQARFIRLISFTVLMASIVCAMVLGGIKIRLSVYQVVLWLDFLILTLFLIGILVML
jgi:hypothetical protein